MGANGGLVPEEVCVDCRKENREWIAHPCIQGDSCIACKWKLKRQKCPICRRLIHRTTRREQGQLKEHKEYLRLKELRDGEVIRSVFQVVVAGPSDSGRDQIEQALREHYTLSSHRPFYQGKMLSEYDCNSRIGPWKTRISAKPAHEPSHDEVENLLDDKTDVIVICASAEKLYSFITFRTLTSQLRSSKNIRILWLLTPGVGNDSPPTMYAQNQELVSYTPEVNREEVTLYSIVWENICENMEALGDIIIRLGREARRSHAT